MCHDFNSYSWKLRKVCMCTILVFFVVILNSSSWSEMEYEPNWFERLKKKRERETRCTFWGKFKTFSAWYARMETYLSLRTDLSSSTFMSWATMSKKIIDGTKIEMLSIMWCVKSASCSFPSEPFHQSQIQDKSKLNWVSKLSVFRWLWCIGSWGKSCQILCNWHFYMHLVFVLDMSMY